MAHRTELLEYAKQYRALKRAQKEDEKNGTD